MTPDVTVKNDGGFPRREQLKGIVETVEVLLAYKAMSFTMAHFALECACGCVGVHMSANVCLRVLLGECP